MNLHQPCWNEPTSTALNWTYINRAELNLHQPCWTQPTSTVLKWTYINRAELNLHQPCWNEHTSTVLDWTYINRAELNLHQPCWTDPASTVLKWTYISIWFRNILIQRYAPLRNENLPVRSSLGTKSIISPVVCSGPFTPGKDPVPILQEDGWAPGPVWTGGKSRPHRDSIPDRPARSQSLYRMSYRDHISHILLIYHPCQIFTVVFLCDPMRCQYPYYVASVVNEMITQENRSTWRKSLCTTRPQYSQYWSDFPIKILYVLSCLPPCMLHVLPFLSLRAS